MTTGKRVFVLVGDEQTPLSPSDVAQAVTRDGFGVASERYGFSETTLRRFLAENGITTRRVLQLERTAPLGDRVVVEEGLSVGG